MSILISTADQINKSPVNQSKAKMMYSFGKGSRFLKGKENAQQILLYRCHQFYQVSQHSASRRATSLGYGRKYDFTKDMPKTPAPGSYESNDLFERNSKKNKGFGFGSGRGEMEKTGFIPQNENPGPGTYQIPSTKSVIHHSMKGKAKAQKFDAFPGPGTYENSSSFNKTGELFSSRFKSKPACKFSKEDKLKIVNYFVPGPGEYESKRTQFSPDGQYYLSRLQSAKSNKFGKALKLSSCQNRCQTPGPGTYRLPSEFGHYVGRNAMENLTNRNNMSYDLST